MAERTLSLLMKSDEKPTFEQAKSLLRDFTKPGWLLNPQGEIAFTNSSVSWIWGIPQGDLSPRIHVFDLLAANLLNERLPLEKNYDLIEVKLATAKRMSGGLWPEGKIVFFSQTIKQLGKKDPKVAKIYAEKDKLSDSTWEDERLWHYSVNILPEGAGALDQLLKFRVDVHHLKGDEGFLTTYEPLQYPSYYPALTLNELWTIVAPNSAYTWLFNEAAHSSFPTQGKHFFELLFWPPLQQATDKQGVNWADTVEYIFKFYQEVRDRSIEQAPEQQRAYETLIERLCEELSDFKPRWEDAAPQRFPKLPDDPSIPVPLGEVAIELPTPLAHQVPLEFTVMIQLHQLDTPQRQITFVPANHTTEVALILIHLAQTISAPRDIRNNSTKQMIWGMALVKTIEDGLRRGAADWRWEPAITSTNLFKQLGKTVREDESSLSAQFGANIADISRDGALRYWILDKLAKLSYDFPRLYRVLRNMERDIYHPSEGSSPPEENQPGVLSPDELAKISSRIPYEVMRLDANLPPEQLEEDGGVTLIPVQFASEYRKFGYKVLFYANDFTETNEAENKDDLVYYISPRTGQMLDALGIPFRNLAGETEGR